MKYLLTLLVVLFVLSVAVNAEGLGRGFGDHIDWVTFEEGSKLSKESGKDMLVILHKTWCGACKRLKPTIENSERFAELSKNFVMVNAENDEEPHSDPSYSIDGSYIPRAYFVSPEGEIRDIFNKDGNPQYKYFYPSAIHLVAAMETASK
eukprot:TRINITY_DN880_c0_g2_i1.p1 TRINITY_DN880_c0_g2~~TRINITY_DN880_c0_g2_i1.p1  ORF type:complete len:150 (-),score=46.75 TRINITY_DN880_c0_g2_i1:103-552(-)